MRRQLLPRGNPSRRPTRPATRNISSCAPTQEHGRDHSCIVGVVQVVGGPPSARSFGGGKQILGFAERVVCYEWLTAKYEIDRPQ